jgi:hypothetical protein
MASFNKKCTYCSNEITISDEIGKKWLPYNADGTAHDCRNKNGNGSKYTLEQVQKKLESLGIIVNIERLMKQQ